jgi:hypothetical protein
MLTTTGIRPFLMQSFPKRTFTVLVDADCLDSLHSKSLESVLQLIIDLSLITPSVDIHLFSMQGKDPLIQKIDPPMEAFKPSKVTDEDPRQKFLGSGFTNRRLQDLCALAQESNADALVTSENDLIAARYALYQYDLICVVPLSELSNFVEICAHGHEVFWSASHDGPLIHDTYYPSAHPEGARFMKWFSNAQPKAASAEILENLRNAIYNRYPFILYARDMVCFYQLQMDSQKRVGHLN